MSMILGGEKPETVGKYVEVVIESLLIIWFNRFGLDINKLPVAVSQAFLDNREVLNSEIAVAKVTCDPMEFSLQLSDNCVEYLLDGTPITAEKLTEVATKMIKVGVKNQFIIEEIKMSLESMNTD